MVWLEVNRLGVGGDNVCCLVMVIIVMALAGKSGRRFKVIFKGKGSKPQSGGAIFVSGVYPLASLSELPTYLSLFWFFGTVYITFLLVKTL